MKKQNNNKTILQLISSKGYYGAENVLVQLADRLHQLNEFNIFAGVLENVSNPHDEVIEVCSKKGINTAKFICKGKLDYKAIVDIRKFVIKNKVDIIHSHGYKANLYAYFATINLKIKRIATCHNWIVENKKLKFYTLIDKVILNKFDWIVGVSDEVVQKILKFIAHKEKVLKIDNGVAIRHNHSLSIENKLKELNIPPDARVIGCVGRLSIEKGHIYLLKAAERLIEKYKDLYFLIIGGGALKKQYENQFKSIKIIFTGDRRDVEALYKCMDIFILPSLTEGLPMVLLEAMSSQLPVIATNVGAINKVMIDRQTGIIIDPGNDKAIVESVKTLLENPSKMHEMGIKGYQRVDQKYSDKNMTKQYTILYKQN